MVRMRGNPVAVKGDKDVDLGGGCGLRARLEDVRSEYGD